MASFDSDSRIGICSWSLLPRDVRGGGGGTGGGTGPQRLVERLSRLNVHSVQLALSPVVSDPKTWANAVNVLRDRGIKIVSGMMAMAGEDYSTLQSIARTGGVRPDATWPANRAHAQSIGDCAAAAGIPLVTFHAGFIPESAGDPERRKLIDRLREIADTFAERSVDLALETGQESADTLLEALHDLDRTNVGVNFDPANMILYGKGDPIAALSKLAGKVRQVHIKDAIPAEAPGTWGKEVPAGAGAVDWDRFFELALAIQPAIDFVIERESRTGQEADLVAARDLIRSHLRARA